MNAPCSAKTLHLLKTALARALPHRGLKNDTPANDVSETNQIQQQLQERANVISETKVERLSSLLRGEWLPDMKVIIVSKNLGKHFHHMGHTRQGQYVLYPEEALYLMDINCMEVYCNELPVSMQEAYCLFLRGVLALESYLVYAHLSRLGYIVVRHKLRSKVEKALTSIGQEMISMETSLNDEKNISTSSKRPVENIGSDLWVSKKTKLTSCITSYDDVSQPCLLVKHPDIHFPNVIGQKVLILECPEKSLLPPNVNISAEKCVINLKSLCHSGETKPLVPNKHTNFESSSSASKFSTRQLHYRCRGQSSREMSYVSQETRSPHWERYKCVESGGRYNVLSTSKEFRRQRVNIDSNWRSPQVKCEKSGDTIAKHESRAVCNFITRGQSSIGCWKDYKIKISRNSYSKECPAKITDILSTSRVQPLITSNDLASNYLDEFVIEQYQNWCKRCIYSILKRLLFIEQVSSRYFMPSSELPDNIFNIYLPNNDYKKTLSQLPNHRLIMNRIEESPPKIDLIAQVMKHFDDEVMLHFAVVDNGEIAIYSFTSVVLPNGI